MFDTQLFANSDDFRKREVGRQNEILHIEN